MSLARLSRSRRSVTPGNLAFTHTSRTFATDWSLHATYSPNLVSIFVQIGDENVHLVRSLLDEVFGSENFCSLITFGRPSGAGSFAGGTNVLHPCMSYYFCGMRASIEARQVSGQLYSEKEFARRGSCQYTYAGAC